MGYTWGISTIDPTIVYPISYLGNLGSESVAFRGDYLFLGSDYLKALMVVDAHDLSDPIVVNRIGLGDKPEGFGFLEDHVLVGGNRCLFSVDIRNIGPHVWSEVPGISDDTAMDVSGNLAVCVGGDLTVVDVSDNQNIRKIGGCVVPGGCLDVKILNRYAYVATTLGLSIVNLRDPEHPFCSGGIATTGFGNGIDIEANVAYLADSLDGLVLIDVQDPVHPEILGTLDIGSDLRDVSVSEGVAYVTGGLPSLYIVDVSDPGNPALLAESRSGRGVVAVHGDLLYMGKPYSSNGISVVDVEDPFNPMVLAEYPTMDYVRDFAMRGDFLFAADSRGGMQIFDASIPGTLEGAGTIGPGLDPYTGGILGVAANSKSLFFVELGKGMKVAPLPCTPGALTVVIASGEETPRVPIDGGMLPYTISVSNRSSAGIWADVRIEVTFPGGTDHLLHERPGILFPAGYTVSSFDLDQFVPPHAPAGEYVYRSIVDPGDGFESSDEFTFEKLGETGKRQGHLETDDRGWILTGWDAEGIPSVAASAGGLTLSCSPNPFNPATVLSFELPGPGPVTLQVYDVAGRLVRTLADRVPFAGGSQELAWNGRDDQGKPSPAGVYFYRLGFRDEWRTGRMVMVK